MSLTVLSGYECVHTFCNCTYHSAFGAHMYIWCLMHAQIVDIRSKLKKKFSTISTFQYDIMETIQSPVTTNNKILKFP